MDGFAQNDADVGSEKKTQHITIPEVLFSPRIGMSFHFLKHHAVVFPFPPICLPLFWQRQGWVPLWKLQSWHLGSIPGTSIVLWVEITRASNQIPLLKECEQEPVCICFANLAPLSNRFWGWQFHRISQFHLNHIMSITFKSPLHWCWRYFFRLQEVNFKIMIHISIPAGRSKWPRATWINGPWMPGNEGSKLESMNVVGSRWHIDFCYIFQLHQALTFANLRVENTHLPIFQFDGPKDFKGNLRRVKESIQDGISCTMLIWLKG